MESSTALETALAAWLAFMGGLGVDMEKHLLPPATEAQLQAAEEEIGFRLPPDLRELYLIANGQSEPTYLADQQETCADEVTYWAPLFGNQTFLPLTQAVEMWHVYNSIHEDNDLSFEVRDGDIVGDKGWYRSWFVFAGNQEDHYSVDTQPPAGGAPGQVVLHGNLSELQVVAYSVTELMQQAARFLDPLDQARYYYSDVPDTGGLKDCHPTLYFDMDWRNQYQNEEEQQLEQQAFEQAEQDWLDRHPRFVTWQEEQTRRHQQRRDQFAQWLLPQGFTDEQARELIDLIKQSGMSMTGGILESGASVVFIPAEVLEELETGEPEEFDNLYALQAMALGAVAAVDNEPLHDIERALEIRYLYSLLSMYFEGDVMFSQTTTPPVEQRIQLISDFHEQHNLISTTLHNGVSEMLIRLKAIAKKSDTEDFGSQYIGMADDAINGGEPVVEICQNDDCTSLSLTPYLSR